MQELIEHNGVEFIVDFSYDGAYLPETLTEPAEHPEFELKDIYMEQEGYNHDVYDMLNESTIDKLCAVADQRNQ